MTTRRSKRDGAAIAPSEIGASDDAGSMNGGRNGAFAMIAPVPSQVFQGDINASCTDPQQPQSSANAPAPTSAANIIGIGSCNIFGAGGWFRASEWRVYGIQSMPKLARFCVMLLERGFDRFDIRALED